MESTIRLDNLQHREETVRRDRTINVALRVQANDGKMGLARTPDPCDLL
jgi:hypothetical protein